MTMTAGASWGCKGRRVSVSKYALPDTLTRDVEAGALKIAHDLPLKNKLMAEIASFERASMAVGNLVPQGSMPTWEIALALAYFVSQHVALGLTAPSYRSAYASDIRAEYSR